jgi:hypothetical protein
LNVKDAVIAVIPDFIVFKKTCRRFFSHLYIEEISCFLVGKGDQIIISEEGKETNDEDDENQWGDDTIEANPSCLKSNDLTMTGEFAEGDEGSEQNGIGNSPLKDYFRNLIEEVFEYQGERGLIFNEMIDPLEEEDNDIDEDQTTQS